MGEPSSNSSIGENLSTFLCHCSFVKLVLLSDNSDSCMLEHSVRAHCDLQMHLPQHTDIHDKAHLVENLDSGDELLELRS